MTARACRYLTSNATVTTCERAEVGRTGTNMWKLWLSFGTNTTLGIIKDRMFARRARARARARPRRGRLRLSAARGRRWYGTRPPAGLPAASWALFFARDIFTIGAGFVLPEYVAAELHRRRLVDGLPAATKVATLLSPVTAQLVLTPVHLLALDIYNHAERDAGARARRIGGAYASLTGTRMARVLFAYGAGGIVNTAVRERLRATW